MILLQFGLVVERIDMRKATRKEEQDQMLGTSDVMSKLGLQRMTAIHGRCAGQPIMDGQATHGGKGRRLP